MTDDLLDHLRPETRRGIDAIAACHEIHLLEAAIRSGPDDLEVLDRLRCLYSQSGRRSENLGILWRLVRLAPTDPLVHFRLACELASSQQILCALTALIEAVRLGYADLDSLLHDRDLGAVRDHPGFQRLLAVVRPEPFPN